MRLHDLHTCGEIASNDIQAVNALLAAIDRLRCRPNVTVFCTTNLIKAVVRESSKCAAYELFILIVD